MSTFIGDIKVKGIEKSGIINKVKQNFVIAFKKPQS